MSAAGIALSGSHLVALVQDADLLARLDLRFDFAVAGIDRLDLAGPGDVTLESTIAVTARSCPAGWCNSFACSSALLLTMPF